ncbi:DUF6207 family protein [Streptomyces viridochromogenes]|nr:DUF6207 family protein [Streptomyces viridochromogenes]
MKPINEAHVAQPGLAVIDVAIHWAEPAEVRQADHRVAA